MFSEKMTNIMLPEHQSFTPELQWVTVSGYNAIVFRIRACQDVRIILASLQGTSEFMASEVSNFLKVPYYMTCSSLETIRELEAFY